MENSSEATNTDILEGVVISNVQSVPQYMIQRIPENTQLLGSELLQQHNGLVVDLNGTDFIPVGYASDGLLTHDLTEEDRNLAAALVAVQLSQQQKQQQLHETNLPNLVDEQQLILSEKGATAINNGYLQIVSEDIYNEKATPLPKIINNQFTDYVEKSEDEKRASDGEKQDARTSRKSLPHKKRISRKLNKTKQMPNSAKIECRLCEQTFSTQNQFAQHQILCETTITPIHHASSAFLCQLCNAGFQDQLKFFEHLKSHYEPVATSTSIDTTVSQQEDEEQHAEQEILDDKQQDIAEPEKDNFFANLNLLNLTCIQCNKTFRRQKAFDAHMKDVHQKDEMNEFSETEDLMEGINVVVESENVSDNDTKQWYREDELHQTEEDLKELEADEHVCHICKQPFSLRALLLQHLVNCRANSGNNVSVTPPPIAKRKNGKKKATLQCTKCDRTFMHRNSLVYHMRSHSGVRPHQCEQCGKSFFASSALKVHLRLHSGDKPYHCTECGKNFRQWGDLKYHMTSLHSNEKQFQCEYCGKDFARKYSLIVHRRIHTGEKNYKCEFCSKTFRASSYLQNHRRIHTGEKPHECETCGKPFRVRSDMKRHQKTHTKRILDKNFRFSNKKSENVKSETESNISVEEYAIGLDDTENTVDSTEPQILSYETVKDETALYPQEHQLFLVSYTDVPGRNEETTTTWIETGGS